MTMLAAAPYIETENRRLVSATVEIADGHFLDVCATLTNHSEPTLRLTWYGGARNGQALDFGSLDQVDELVAALLAVRDRCATEKRPK